MSTAEAYIGLGSNLGDSVAEIRAALAALSRVRGISVDACSSLYRTGPVGELAQPDFVNAVCRVQTSLAPRALLEVLLDIEAQRGRLRRGASGGPRILDLDLLLYDGASIDSPGLVVPHPRLHERAFVLYPLVEIAPSLNVPGRGPVQALAGRCAGQRVERLAEHAGADGA
jgi:2-amino-4-hydroxy-6-hydroxymethyldihydropteridine diphosphokinase